MYFSMNDDTYDWNGTVKTRWDTYLEIDSQNKLILNKNI